VTQFIKPSQLEGLRHVTWGFLHGLVSNRPSMPKDASLNPGSLEEKTKREVKMLLHHKKR
jgi:hypothetical protein